jgi:benzylsuccinate CoA-transferase BbsF subunit
MTLAIEGVRVVEFTTALAGPLAGRYLAEAGAEVIKVESEHGGLDSFRVFSDDGNVDGSARYLENNLGVKSVRLNLRNETGLRLATELLAVSDVLIDNFRPDVLERLGLGVETVRAANPGLIVLKMPGFGSTGPRFRQGSWGPNLLAHGGMTHLWNHPGLPEPVGSQSVYPDYVAGALAPALVAAALLRRLRTGKGAYIDLAQVELMAYLLGVSALELALTGEDPQPIGNRSLDAAPQGCYPCLGDDRWCVISVETEEQWIRLSRVMGRPELASNPRYATRAARLEHQDELDQIVGSFTVNWDPGALTRMLQEAGVPCGAVQDARDLWSDPQLRHRGLIAEVDHPLLGAVSVPRLPISISDGGIGPPTPSPLLGAHEEEVICELLGYSEGELEEFRSLQAVE